MKIWTKRTKKGRRSADRNKFIAGFGLSAQRKKGPPASAFSPEVFRTHSSGNSSRYFRLTSSPQRFPYLSFRPPRARERVVPEERAPRGQYFYPPWFACSEA